MSDVPEKSISDSVAFASAWHNLTHNQKRFAVAMMSCATKKEAAEAIGLQPDTVYRWNGDLDAVIDFMRNEAAAAALGIVTANAGKAAMVIGGLLDSDDENIRLRAGQDVLDRTMGRATQRQEINQTGPVVIRVALDDDDAD